VVLTVPDKERALARAYGSKEGQESYVPRADINSGGEIDWKDLILLAMNYGKTS